jgi:hypothetical protein
MGDAARSVQAGSNEESNLAHPVRTAIGLMPGAGVR